MKKKIVFFFIKFFFFFFFCFLGFFGGVELEKGYNIACCKRDDKPVLIFNVGMCRRRQKAALCCVVINSRYICHFMDVGTKQR